MKTIVLSIKKEECADSVCPMPLNVIPNVEKRIKKITYDEKTEQATITFDEKKITEQEVMEKLRKIGYTVPNQ